MKKILSIILALALVCAMLPAAGVAAADDFSDVPQDSWFANAVKYAVENGLMNGVGGGKFDPDGSMTRAMLVTVLWRYEGSTEEGENTFKDVPDGQWYTKAVAWAAKNGIVGGVGDGKFDPDGNVTREQMAAILYRYAQKKGLDTTKSGDLSKFPDAGKVSDWAKEAIAWTVAEGIIGGSDGKLLPQGNATRAQVSTIFMRYIEDVVKAEPEPTEKPTEPTDAPTEPTAAPTEPTEPSIVTPSDIPTDPTLKPTTEPTEPTGEPTEATEAPTEPTTAPTEPTAAPTEPEPTEPEPTEPEPTEPEPTEAPWRVALITDCGDIDDGSYNQTVYESGKTWCEENGIDFTYYQPAEDSMEARIDAIAKAVGEGYNALLLPGYVFADVIMEIAVDYPETCFIGLDIGESDLGTYDEEWNWTPYTLPANVFCASFREELAGYMAGYAAVKMGYKQLGFLGGMAAPAVVRYGFGFVQGADQAAKELEITDAVSVKYVYGNQFFPDADITAYMDGWYADGTEVVFACGGGIYISAAEAAAKVGGKMIGVDVDQAKTLNEYAEGMAITSAMKGITQTVFFVLDELIVNDNWDALGGQAKALGLVSEDPAEACVRLAPSTQWNEGFTEEDYAALVAGLFNGELTVSADTEAAPTVTISVDYQEDIKGTP